MCMLSPRGWSQHSHPLLRCAPAPRHLMLLLQLSHLWDGKLPKSPRKVNKTSSCKNKQLLPPV